MYYDEREDIDYSILNINNTEEKKTKYYDNDITFDVNNLNINNFRKDKVKDLYSSKEGLNKGNMFKNEYDPYKNYIYKVVVKGERDSLLLKIQELSFKVVDLNLYLDIFPGDTMMFEEFKKTLNELKKEKEMYEKTYGPLCLDGTIYSNTYNWDKNPWPWMNEGGNK